MQQVGVAAGRANSEAKNVDTLASELRQQAACLDDEIGQFLSDVRAA